MDHLGDILKAFLDLNTEGALSDALVVQGVNEGLQLLRALVLKPKILPNLRNAKEKMMEKIRQKL